MLDVINKPVKTKSTGCRTLIVEDDPLGRKSLCAILQHLGHSVTSAASLADGFHRIDGDASSMPQCMLLDLMLPDGSGLELLQRIREQHLPIRVAVMTGGFDPVMLDRVKSLEPEALFYKPLDVPKLVAWIKEQKRSFPA
jgi:two-component system, OmpR family, response regulator